MDIVEPFQPVPLFDDTLQPMSPELQKSELMKENWFHGSISRASAEALLKVDGDFLVRESQANPGQYVLTGIQGIHKKHLLLIDPKGIVSILFNRIGCLDAFKYCVI